MHLRRADEPDYALIPDQAAPVHNRYGRLIDLVPTENVAADSGLRINGKVSTSEYANRYQQHGFYFNADNCIACHACESACSEKNDLPPHLAFRAVGYVEGGTWPDYQRLNISMACNHCDDPVCLKGCPTRAYTKFAEYGAVLQDPDICFGCGYCTWVCPYNAPQLDPVKGQVEKCNMCVDRLEVGLKPACVSACLAGALDFGVIETKPERRDQLEATIPGFPTPEITHPNIRFQQTRALPRELHRTDAMPLRYIRNEHGQYEAAVRKDGRGRAWNLEKLRSREDPLVIFTLISQAVVGAFIALILGPHFGLPALAPDAHPVAYPALLFGLLALETAALALSTMHLGKPHRFYRAFNNLRYSPVSREVAGIALFYNCLLGYALLTAFPGLFGWLPEGWPAALRELAAWGGVATGPLALYFMQAIYRIRARPFWNHWQVSTSFYGSMLALGPLVVLAVYAPLIWAQGGAQGGDYATLAHSLSLPIALGLLLEGVGLYAHARSLQRQGGEGAASHYEQTTHFGYTYMARNLGLLLAFGSVIALGMAAPAGSAGLVLWAIAAVLILATAVVGRALFYVLVIPTTMPGAFFWRNRGFQEHARETGLARMPQVGVIAEAH